VPELAVDAIVSRHRSPDRGAPAAFTVEPSRRARHPGTARVPGKADWEGEVVARTPPWFLHVFLVWS
jgi:hypothetical protein